MSGGKRFLSAWCAAGPRSGGGSVIDVSGAEAHHASRGPGGRLLFGGARPRTRREFQEALLDLCRPFTAAAALEGRLEAVGHPGTVYPRRTARLELLARLLWGLAPLAAGGPGFAGRAGVREQIAAGTDPGSAAHWGLPGPHDQRLVEAAALGFALALAPHEAWQPLAPAERRRPADWLGQAAAAAPVDNNWHLVPTLVRLGLAAVGESAAKPRRPGTARGEAATEAAFRRIDDFHLGDGWYADGPDGSPPDHYGPWAIHYYGLLHAGLGAIDGARAATVRARAAAFAPEHVHWFADDGAALAIGRSLTYRFAQGAFLGAQAFAGTPAMPWGVLRGLWARHLRWWGGQPVRDGDGTLSVGHAYPNLLMSESYNGPGSPYGAFKAFLPLALPETHPFWSHPEEPPPAPASGECGRRTSAGRWRGRPSPPPGARTRTYASTPGWCRRGSGTYGSTG